MSNSDTTPVLGKGIYSDLGIETGDMSFLAVAPEAFLDPGSTFPVSVGKRVSFMASVGNKFLTSYATLQPGAILTHVSLHERTSQAGKGYYQVTGAVSRMAMELVLVIEGQEVPLTRFLTGIVNAELPENKRITVDAFRAMASRLRMNYDSTLPMFWYHPGADLNKWEAFVDRITAFGAVDLTANIADPRSIRQSISLGRIGNGGLEIASMDIGSTDRSQSATGQGFVDFVEAAISHFMRVVALRKQAREMETALAADIEAGKLKEEAVREVRSTIAAVKDESISMTRRASWGGSQPGFANAPDGSRIKTGDWYSTNVPIGRMKLIAPNGDDFDMDFWSRGQGSENTANITTVDTSAVVDTSVTSGTDTEEEPF